MYVVAVQIIVGLERFTGSLDLSMNFHGTLSSDWGGWECAGLFWKEEALVLLSTHGSKAKEQAGMCLPSRVAASNIM